MDFQAMYENIQNEIKNKVTQIDEKKKEISIMEADIYKMQGATEMLVLISKQMEQQPKEEIPVEKEIVEIIEPPTADETK